MRRLILPLLLAVLSLGAAEPCAVDRARLMALDQKAFDQDMTGGWRALANRRGCEAVAADIIRDYREGKGLKDSILYWHEGQMRAMAGDYPRAERLFALSRKPVEDGFGWNAYVTASIAFLRGDRARLGAARAELAALPPVEGFAKMAADMKAKTGFSPTWPPNLDVVDALSACVGKPYAVAYGPLCRTPVKVEPPRR